MATKEEAEIEISALIRALNGREQEYAFFIPGWSRTSAETGSSLDEEPTLGRLLRCLSA